MKSCKYVIVQYEKLGGLQMPILLPACMDHNAVAAAGKVVSAGFVDQADPEAPIRCSGSSFTLGIGSRGAADAEIISYWFPVLSRPQLVPAHAS